MTSLEVEASASAAAYSAFGAWASAGEVRVWFTPDTAMAVECDECRGYLLDEVYFVTLWANRGFDELLALLEAELVAAGHTMAECVRQGDEPGAEEMLEAILRCGSPIEQVRDLL